MYDITNDTARCIWIAWYKSYRDLFLKYFQKNPAALFWVIFSRNLQAAAKYI